MLHALKGMLPPSYTRIGDYCLNMFASLEIQWHLSLNMFESLEIQCRQCHKGWYQVLSTFEFGIRWFCPGPRSHLGASRGETQAFSFQPFAPAGD